MQPETTEVTQPFATIMSALDPPMAVVTAATPAERAGCLVGFHAQSSIHPNRYVVWLSKANHTCRVGLRATHLGVHFLGRGDREVAEAFGTRSGDDGDKFAGWDFDIGEGLAPVLRDCVNGFVGRRVALLDEGGDHVCVVLEPVCVWATDGFRPLRLADVEDLEPGHPVGDRPQPRTQRAG
jgi:flavin reductase (DIM6/NTAB) family NADH-FMN oxidoreductase RutF